MLILSLFFLITRTGLNTIFGPETILEFYKLKICRVALGLSEILSSRTRTHIFN